MEDVNYFELFGVELPAAGAEGGKEPETTEPAQGEERAPEGQTEGTGDADSHVADDAAPRNDRGAEGAGMAPGQKGTIPLAPSAKGGREGDKAGDAETEDGREPQTPEENAKYAAARRKAEAERDAAVAQAKQDAEAQAMALFEEHLRAAGLKNPFTQKPITTVEELDAYRTEYAARRKAEMQRKSGTTDDEMQQFIDSLPEVQAAKREKAEAEAARKAAQDAEARAALDEQLKEIQKLDPRIRSFEDLAKTETYPELYRQVQQGKSILEAYKLANWDALMRSAAEAARQEARNAAEGKDHLARTVQRGQGGAEVPPDVMAEYRVFNPDATEAEIRAHWSRSRATKR